jgi:hypothetical protein
VGAVVRGGGADARGLVNRWGADGVVLKIPNGRMRVAVDMREERVQQQPEVIVGRADTRRRRRDRQSGDDQQRRDQVQRGRSASRGAPPPLRTRAGTAFGSGNGLATTYSLPHL